ncbi:RNA-directed DNA polymerase from mobile element jockey-like [Brachionus plicatilis]|uniref:RNA-directed DNA polymerase from mobile element jockey-like n=1 Tax=Brachionus plicatilis TaxID=10195 RepID=A0A3M7S1T0_BRAPC|nr:RNA-directed DNA polymerase from mobile element jockey-like [Brachionus plicatilis]
MCELYLIGNFINTNERIILNRIEKVHIDHRKQFGFKKNSSCQHAIFTVKQTIKYCKHKDRLLYLCAIDASKVFDKIDREVLWNKMIAKNIDPAIIMTLKNYYDESLLLVKNEDEYSNMFKSTIGVKKGGVASPKLFSIHIEDLITQLEMLDVGIKLKKIKLDVVLYADDIMLISTCKYGLQRQLHIVQKYGLENGIKYNLDKTEFMLYNDSIGTNQEHENRLELDYKLIK